jgi:FAD/FMN-containing dehydrogenase
MSKISKYLQEHISGEVVTSDAVREHFSRDTGILKQSPDIVIFPNTVNDIRKVSRFCWQLGEQGHTLPLTVRGAGQSDNGASINKGVILSLQTHYNEVFEFDAKQRLVRLQPGALIADVQKILKTYGFRLNTNETRGTVGGFVASNLALGNAWVKQLEVVLADGEVLQTGPLSRRELSNKKGLTSLEGEIYRAVDAAVNDNSEAISRFVGGGNAAKALTLVNSKKGFDLTPIFLGSQGTLGIISELIITVTPIFKDGALLAAGFDSASDLESILPLVNNEHPDSLSIVDREGLRLAAETHGYDFEGLLEIMGSTPNLLMFIEFSGNSERKDNARAGKLSKNLVRQGISTAYTPIRAEQDKWRHLRRAAAKSGTYSGEKPVIPILSDIMIPVTNFTEFYDGYKKLSKDEYIDVSFGASVQGNALSVQIYPRLDLYKLNDRQKVFKMIDDFHRLAASLNGRIGATYGEGRLYAPYVNAARTPEERELLKTIKTACDPHNVLNPDAVYNEDLKKVAPLLNQTYTLRLASDVLPT